MRAPNPESARVDTFVINKCMLPLAVASGIDTQKRNWMKELKKTYTGKVSRPALCKIDKDFIKIAEVQAGKVDELRSKDEIVKAVHQVKQLVFRCFRLCVLMILRFSLFR